MKKWFKTAKSWAEFSSHKFHHGAVLVKGGKFVRGAYNKPRSVAFVNKFRKYKKFGSLHAEVGLVLNLWKEVTEDCDIYVCRIRKDGSFAMSKPCEMCQLLAKEMKIKRIFYTLGDKKYGCVKL